MLQTLAKVEQETEADQLKRVFVKVMVEVAETIPETPTLEDIATLKPLIEHIKAVPNELNQWLEDQDIFWSYTGLAFYYNGQGLYASAEPWFQDCLTATQTRLGENHPDTASSLNGLGSLSEVLNPAIKLHKTSILQC
jgi:hypothetical protein